MATRTSRSSLGYYALLALALLATFVVYVLISSDVFIIKAEKILLFITFFFIFIYIIFEKREKQE